MSRFFVPKEFVKANSIYVTGKEAHHILNVMRLKVLDEVMVFDGTGREYTGIVKATDRRSLEIQIKNVCESSSEEKPSITLIQAITKKDKMDYISEKATELGVSRIIPIITKRTVPEWNDAKKASIVDRWRNIAREAAKQCGRSDVPEVCQIAEFKHVITGAVRMSENEHNTAPVYDLKLIAALSDKTIKLKDALNNNIGKNIAIAIGPEGDFTPGEIEDAVKAGFKIVSLGPRVMKSDTAGLAVLSIINYEYAE